MPGPGPAVHPRAGATPEHTGGPERARLLVATRLHAGQGGHRRPGRLPRRRRRRTARFVADLEALREAVGPDADFGIDLHGRVSLPHARRLADAVAHTRRRSSRSRSARSTRALIGRLVASTTIPIATGERLFCREEFLPVLEAGIAIAQPDPAARRRHHRGVPHRDASPSRTTCSSRRTARSARSRSPHASSSTSPCRTSTPRSTSSTCTAAGSPDLRILRNPEVLVPVDGPHRRA